MNSGGFFKPGSRFAHALAAIAFAGMAGCVVAWQPQPEPPPQAAYAPPPPESPANPELQQLVAPIALYPDPILADVLPAATYPDQVQQAAQFLQAYPQPPDEQIASQPWDPSVQALVHYPSVVQYMAGDPQWTASLGAAFASQPDQVMAAIQDLRAQAYAEGNLASNSDEVVVQDGGCIYLRPAVDDVIVIPFYDPVFVYRQHYPIEYRYHYRDGVWLNHGFDWQHHDVYVGDWHRGWVGGPGGWHRDPGWVAPGQPWAHDDRRFGPAPQVPAGHYVQPRAAQGRDFHPVPAQHAAVARPVAPVAPHAQAPAPHVPPPPQVKPAPQPEPTPKAKSQPEPTPKAKPKPVPQPKPEQKPDTPNEQPGGNKN
jgi:hypothetical protein